MATVSYLKYQLTVDEEYMEIYAKIASAVCEAIKGNESRRACNLCQQKVSTMIAESDFRRNAPHMQQKRCETGLMAGDLRLASS